MNTPGLPVIVGSSRSRGAPKSISLPTPNWNKWKFYGEVELWQGAALVLNIEPDFLEAQVYKDRSFRIPFSDAIPEFRLLFGILENRYCDIVRIPSGDRAVMLQEIAKFVNAMEGRPYTLPPEFPGAPSEITN